MLISIRSKGIHLLRQLKIKKRLGVLFFLASVIPIVLIGGYEAYRSYQNMKELAMDYSKRISEISAANMELHFAKYEEQIQTIASNHSFLDRLQNYEKQDWDKKKEIENEMRLMVYSVFGENQEVDTVEMVSKNGTRFYFLSPVTGRSSRLLEEVETDGGTVWRYGKKEAGKDEKKYIIISRLLGDGNKIFVSLNKDYVDELCQNHVIGSQWVTGIIDGEGTAVTNEDIFKEHQGKNAGAGNGLSDKMFVMSYPVQSMGWDIVQGIPYEDLLAGAKKQILITAVLVLLLAAVVILLTKIMSESITRPLSKLITAVRQGKTGEPIPDSGRDEYREVIDGFNHMNEKRTHMILEAYHMELEKSRLDRLKKEAELSALQKQINPHFLYNTLETIYWNGQYEGAEEISDMVIAMGNYFRTIISKGKEYTSVKEEAASVDNYLFLQNIRFGNRLFIQWDFEDGTRESRILKLVLQPVIEDMLNQLLEIRRDKIMLHIDVSKKEGDILFTICTDQLGYSDGEADMLHMPGCKNVDQRLRLYFGDDYGVKILENKEYRKINISENHEYKTIDTSENKSNISGYKIEISVPRGEDHNNPV